MIIKRVFILSVWRLLRGNEQSTGPADAMDLKTNDALIWQISGFPRGSDTDELKPAITIETKTGRTLIGRCSRTKLLKCHTCNRKILVHV